MFRGQKERGRSFRARQMLLGSPFFPSEMSDFVLAILKNMADPRVSDTLLVARVLELVLRGSCSDLYRVEDLVEIIYRQLACVSRMVLWDILMFTLLRLADIDSYEVVTGLLRVSWPCDK
ncbi:uncharacterized protein FN964_015570 isoform 1-T1 [Alca torda]